MTPIQHTEPARTGEHVLSEAAGSRSREAIVVASGAHAAGTVLAMAADGTYVAHDPTASDGTEIAAGILYGPADAREGPVPAVAHVRDCEVNGTGVTWAADMTDDQLGAMNATLMQAGIILRGVELPAGLVLSGGETVQETP